MLKKLKTDLLWSSWVKRYPGRYIAVLDGKVKAVAKSRLAAFKKVEKQLLPKQAIGIFYIPSPHQYPMLLRL